MNLEPFTVPVAYRLRHTMSPRSRLWFFWNCFEVEIARVDAALPQDQRTCNRDRVFFVARVRTDPRRMDDRGIYPVAG